MNPATIVADRLVAPAPAERLAVLRILVGTFATGYLLARLPFLFVELRLPAYRWAPVGVFENLSAPPPAGLVTAGLLVTVAAGVGFTTGWRWRWTGPLFALGALGTFSYGLSWGHIRHTEHLLLLHLLVIGLFPAADALSFDHRAGRTPRVAPIPRSPDIPRSRSSSPQRAASETEPPSDGDDARTGFRYGFPVRLVCVITVLTYAIAGWMKLRNGGWEWLSGEVLRNQVAFDNLRKVVLGDHWSALGAHLVATGWFWWPLGVATVAVELGAPLALFGGRIRTVWVASAWLFHVGILALMAIMFPYPLSGVAFASFFPIERLADRDALARQVQKVRTVLKGGASRRRPVGVGPGTYPNNEEDLIRCTD